MSKDIQTNLYRKLPSVDKLLELPDIKELAGKWRRELIVAAINEELYELRLAIKENRLNQGSLEDALSALPDLVANRVDSLNSPSFKRVVNATGVVVHTNLGRSPLPQNSLNMIHSLAGRYLNLEFDLKTGKRGNRDSGIRRLLKLLFPGYDAVVVNNNAAAVLLILNTLAAEKEVIISKGRIIEIGDSFRINQIQEKSGATLREVGTTNRTHLQDFQEAISEKTALLMSVHPSNYRVIGFTAEVSLAELVELGNSQSLPVIEDWGSGCIAEPKKYGIKNEESAHEVLSAKPDAICFSGDKLLGGPQAGIIIGKPDVITRIRRNHLYRALRVDKLTLIGLEEVIRAYLKGDEQNQPILEMLGRSLEDLEERAKAIVSEIGNDRLEIVKVSGRVGGGAAPEVEISSLALKIPADVFNPHELKESLRRREIPIIVRVKDEGVYLDLRTVFPDEDSLITQALMQLL